MGRLKASRKRLLGAIGVALTLLFWQGFGSPEAEVRALTEPAIQHSALDCIANNQFTVATAVIEPGQEIRTARVYFRSDQYPDFYYVDMEQEGDNFKAVLPMPSEETQHVIYYVEAVSVTFDSARTEEHDPIVAADSECKRRDPMAAWFRGDNPSIVVGATVANVPNIPPGFQAVGISGFITAAGTVSGAGGGGLGTAGVVAIAGAGAGAAAGLAIATGGGESASGPSPGGGTSPATTTTAATTSAPGTTTTTAVTENQAPLACFTIDPPSATVKVGENVKLDARCSKGDESGGGDAVANYEWDLGDGRVRSGPDLAFITPKWNSPGVYTVKLTVTDAGGSGFRSSPKTVQLQDEVTHQVTVEATLKACFQARDIPNDFMCNMEADASCSIGSIQEYDWIIDVGGKLGSPIRKSGQEVTYTWLNCFSPQDIAIRLTVHGTDGETDSVTQTLAVSYLTSPFLKQTEVSTSFASYLGVAPFDGSARGHVTVNSVRTDPTDNSAPFQHQVKGRLGENVVEATTATPLKQPGFWRFSFNGAAHFVSGSIKVHSGQVISSSGDTVVFRLSGTAGERIRFSFQLLP